MHPNLKLTGFLESFNGEPELMLQIQWKNVCCSNFESFYTVPVVQDISLYSVLHIPYDSLRRSPPSELNISRSFPAARFSTPCSRYLAPKIAAFVLNMAASFGAVSPPSLFVFAELQTLIRCSGIALSRPISTAPLIPHRQDLPHQSRGSSLIFGLSYPGDTIFDSKEERADGVSAPAIYKLKQVTLSREDKEAGDCSVCLSEMSDIEELLSTPGDHIFHAQCILSWMERKNSCPLCRSLLHD